MKHHLLSLSSVFLFYLLSGQHVARAQIDTISETSYNSCRFKMVLGAGALFYGGTLTGLSTLWYSDQEWVGFHWFNDNQGWEQIDKFGHAYTSYMMGKAGIEALKWAGVSRKKSIIYGGSFGLLFLSSVEFLDGHYRAWGASPGDVGCNAFGSLLLIGQELVFDKQIVTMKFSYHPTELYKYRPDQLGTKHTERIIKDYNGQTYWFSVNYRDVFKQHTRVPKWMCLSAGYGAYGMLGGDQNPRYYRNNLIPVVDRYKRYFFTLDVDFEKIPTNSRFLKRTFFFLNLIKFPLPTLEYNTNGSWVFHPVYF